MALQKENPLRLANMALDEVCIHRESGRVALVNAAWELTNAETALCNAENNRALFQSLGIDAPQCAIASLEQATARKLAARDAFTSCAATV